MSRILVIKNGLFGDNSQSNKMVELFLSARKAAGLEDEIIEHDFGHSPLPHLTAEEMQAWMTPADELTDNQKQLVKISDELIDEFLSVEQIVIGMPLYNLTIPSGFKSYIDRICRAGKTFTYTEQGPKGLVANKPVWILAARGGQYQGSEFDTQTPYIKNIFGLMGITDVHFIYAEGLNMGEAVAQQSWQAVEQKIHGLFA
jgi:FMN-dependent NADH-azoreductase